jgi:hypothetical protein
VQESKNPSMQKKKIKGLHFQPWIGENYEKSIYGKLLPPGCP